MGIPIQLSDAESGAKLCLESVAGELTPVLAFGITVKVPLPNLLDQLINLHGVHEFSTTRGLAEDDFGDTAKVVASETFEVSDMGGADSHHDSAAVDAGWAQILQKGDSRQYAKQAEEQDTEEVAIDPELHEIADLRLEGSPNRLEKGNADMACRFFSNELDSPLTGVDTSDGYDLATSLLKVSGSASDGKHDAEDHQPPITRGSSENWSSEPDVLEYQDEQVLLGSAGCSQEPSAQFEVSDAASTGAAPEGTAEADAQIQQSHTENEESKQHTDGEANTHRSQPIQCGATPGKSYLLISGFTQTRADTKSPISNNNIKTRLHSLIEGDAVRKEDIRVMKHSASRKARACLVGLQSQGQAGRLRMEWAQYAATLLEEGYGETSAMEIVAERARDLIACGFVPDGIADEVGASCSVSASAFAAPLSGQPFNDADQSAVAQVTPTTALDNGDDYSADALGRAESSQSVMCLGPGGDGTSAVAAPEGDKKKEGAPDVKPGVTIRCTWPHGAALYQSQSKSNSSNSKKNVMFAETVRVEERQGHWVRSKDGWLALFHSENNELLFEVVPEASVDAASRSNTKELRIQYRDVEKIVKEPQLKELSIPQARGVASFILRELPPTPCSGNIRLLDFAQLALNDECLIVLLEPLMERKPRLQKITLHKNRLGDKGALAIAELIKKLPSPIEEIHLSHNYIERRGARALLSAVGHHKAYPRQQDKLFVPLFLRIEHNRGLAGFASEAEAEIVASRRAIGWALPQSASAICCENRPCTANYCSLSKPGQPWPVVHLPYLHLEGVDRWRGKKNTSGWTVKDAKT